MSGCARARRDRQTWLRRRLVVNNPLYEVHRIVFFSIGSVHFVGSGPFLGNVAGDGALSRCRGIQVAASSGASSLPSGPWASTFLWWKRTINSMSAYLSIVQAVAQTLV